MKNIEITSINIKFINSIHTINLAGKFNAKNININIPFRNTFNNSLFIINKINSEAPFFIKEIDPRIPIKIEYGELIKIKLKIIGPDYAYSGPINLDIS